MCDLLSREISSSKFDLGEVRRSLLVSNSNVTRGNTSNVALKAFNFRFVASGRCRGCQVDANLFDDGFRRSCYLMNRSKQQQHPDIKQRRLDQGTNPSSELSQSSCVCKSEKPEFRTPSPEEFTTSVNDSIKQLEQMGKLTNIKKIASIEEPEEIQNDFIDHCTQPVHSFATAIEIPIASTSNGPDLPPVSDLDTVAWTFMEGYNGFTKGELCDPLGRQIANVVYDAVPTQRHLQPSIFSGSRTNMTNSTPMSSFNDNNATNVTNGPVVFVWRLLAIGQCRGCETDTSLFDDGFRCLSTSNDNIHFGKSTRARQNIDPVVRRLASEDPCRCLSENAEFRGPQKEEFAIVLSENIEELAKDGELKSVEVLVEDVEDVEEVADAGPVLECAYQVSTFTTELTVELEMNHFVDVDGMVGELSVLEPVMMSGFNDLSMRLCHGMCTPPRPICRTHHTLSGICFVPSRPISRRCSCRDSSVRLRWGAPSRTHRKPSTRVWWSTCGNILRQRARSGHNTFRHMFMRITRMANFHVKPCFRGNCLLSRKSASRHHRHNNNSSSIYCHWSIHPRHCNRNSL